MPEYNSYQQMHYKAKFGNKTRVRYIGNWNLIYLGQFIIYNAPYSVCYNAKKDLEKNKFTIKEKIIFTHAK